MLLASCFDLESDVTSKSKVHVNKLGYQTSLGKQKCRGIKKTGQPTKKLGYKIISIELNGGCLH